MLAPLAITLYILRALFGVLDNTLGNVVARIVGFRIPGIGAVLTLLFTAGVGMVAANVGGRQLIAFGERLLTRIPLVRSVYVSVKQLIDAFALQNKGVFLAVVMIEYPRPGIYSIGFMTNRGSEALSRQTGEELIGVFIPTTPNPTSGFFMLVPAEDCQVLDMTIEEAFKVIISGGVFMPGRSLSVRGARRE